jgi:DNA-binding TFAR19-related protein (PDSD5 family)
VFVTASASSCITHLLARHSSDQAANLKVADVLADYVTTVEKTAVKLIATGKINEYINKCNLTDLSKMAGASNLTDFYISAL